MGYRISLFFFAVFALSACNKQVQDFVKAARPPNIQSPVVTPPAAVDSPMSLKVSPGQVTSVGGGKAMTANITPTQKVFAAGGDMSAQLTLSRGRVSPQ